MRRITVAMAVLAVIFALSMRVVIEGRGALASGDAWRARGRGAEAIHDYETAARWYLPLAPHVDEAYGRLRELAASNEAAVQLAAWRAIRGAARATRWIATPHAADLAAADAAIATLAAKAAGAPAPTVAGPSPPSRDPAWHRERLAWDPRPAVGALVLAAVGIALWLVGSFVLVRRGVDRDGARQRPALPAAIAILVGMACWLVGLYNA